MTQEQLDELARLEAAASPGPWPKAGWVEDPHGVPYGIGRDILNGTEKERIAQAERDTAFIATMRKYALPLVKEVRRLQEVEAASRLFGMVVPPCDCGAYENSTKPCSANCRIDVRFRTAIGGEAQVSP